MMPGMGQPITQHRNVNNYSKQVLGVAGDKVTTVAERRDILARAFRALEHPGDHDLLVVVFAETVAALRDAVPEMVYEYQLLALAPGARISIVGEQTRQYLKSVTGTWAEYPGLTEYSSAEVTGLGDITVLAPSV